MKISPTDMTKRTAAFVRNKLSGEGTGHDWFHIERVWKMATHIANREGGDRFVIEQAALLHDIADWKFTDGDEEAGPRAARQWLDALEVDSAPCEHICDIIATLSFKGAGVQSTMKTKEGMIVQDADRLDALGAIGIARAFSYGGYKKRELYNPTVSPQHHATFAAYKNSNSTTINHFYEKLLLLRDLMNTETAKRMAEQRHAYMEDFLRQFYEEWEGKS